MNNNKTTKHIPFLTEPSREPETENEGWQTWNVIKWN